MVPPFSRKRGGKNEERKEVEEQKPAVVPDDVVRPGTPGLEKIPMVAMVDTSGSMECDECIPLNNAIGLGIRVSELTHPAFRNMVLTFDHTPQWISLEDCGDFHSKVWKLKRAAWGTSTRIYLAFKMILDACIQNKVPPIEVTGMVLAVFSDMQIDCGYINDCPYGDNDLASDIEKMYLILIILIQVKNQS